MSLDEINAISNIFYLKYVQSNKIFNDFCYSNYRFFYIVAALETSSKFIGGDLSMAVDGKFVLLFMFILVSMHRKVSVNATQPLLTTM